MATPGPKTSTFPSPGKSTSTRATSGMPSAKLPMANLVAVWLRGGQDRQLSVDQFVLQDGRLYRTQEAHERLQAICARLGNPELAERAFGKNYAASIMAREKNAWKPTPVILLPDIQKACVETDTAGLELDGL